MEYEWIYVVSRFFQRSKPTISSIIYCYINAEYMSGITVSGVTEKCCYTTDKIVYTITCTLFYCFTLSFILFIFWAFWKTVTYQFYKLNTFMIKEFWLIDCNCVVFFNLLNEKYYTVDIICYTIEILYAVIIFYPFKYLINRSK